MHPSIKALIELHEVNQRRQDLMQDLGTRKARLAKAHAMVQEAEVGLVQGHQDVENMAALIRQYTADVERCAATVQELRTKQMEAKSNKEYLAIINGIEEARAETKLRESSLADLNVKVDEKRQAAEVLVARVTELQDKYAAFAAENRIPAEAQESIDRLTELYNQRRAAVDPNFLKVYERLIQSGNKMPLVPIDPTTRATTLGNIISQNQMEQIRNGSLEMDQMTNGILYINEAAASE